MRNLETSYPGGDDDDDWEIEGIISSPTTRSLDRSFYECGYQAQQEQQAQVQIPPK